MLISIKKGTCSGGFEGDEYVIDLSRRFGGYEAGDLIIYGCPFGPIYLPLQLEIAIKTDGTMHFRSWRFSRGINPYFHTDETPDKFVPTPEQTDTVNGLFSSRLKFEDLELSPGATIQSICPIDVAREESLTGKKLYLNNIDKRR